VTPDSYLVALRISGGGRLMTDTIISALSSVWFRHRYDTAVRLPMLFDTRDIRYQIKSTLLLRLPRDLETFVEYPVTHGLDCGTRRWTITLNRT